MNRKEEKQRRKEKIAEKRAAGLDVPPPKRWKKMEDSQCKIKVLEAGMYSPQTYMNFFV